MTITSGDSISIHRLINLSKKLTYSAERVISFFENKLQQDGSYGDDAQDLACYYKSPMMFISRKKPEEAIRVLNYIKNRFMLKNGDFSTTPSLKSTQPEYGEYWSYINGWVVRAANQLKLTNIVKPGYKYLTHSYLSNNLGVLTHSAQNLTSITDVLTVAHNGLINLEMGNLGLAASFGNYLCEAIKKQPKIEVGFYLRFNKQGEPITEFKEEQIHFNFISRFEPDQLHFMIGYPAAYLALLYKETHNEKFLLTAKEYLDFSLSCHESIYQCNFSHKIAWAASIIYEITSEEKYIDVVERITHYFLSSQHISGLWYQDTDINTAYDQSTELAYWFLEISKNMSLKINHC